MAKTTCFMDYTKLQQDIIKATLKGDRQTYKLATFTTPDGLKRILVCINGHTAVFVPAPFWFLDTEAINKEMRNSLITETACNDFYKLPDEATDIKLTTEMISIPGTKKIAKVFRNSDGIKIYVDQALLDTFKTAEEVHYMGTHEKAPVYVFRGHDLLGICLPVRING